jgi:hypothetical protein
MRESTTSARRGGPHSRSEVRGRRGRPRNDDYAVRVCEVLRRTAFELEDCTELAQLPGVQRLAKQQAREMAPVGAAIRTLLDQAVSDVERLAQASDDRASQRIATFLTTLVSRATNGGASGRGIGLEPHTRCPRGSASSCRAGGAAVP